MPVPPDPHLEQDEIPPDPVYSMLGHIPGTFSIDMSPTATTDPASVLLPEVDKNLPEVWQQRFHDLSKEFYKIFIKDFSGDPWSQGLHEVHLQPHASPYASRAFRLPKTHLDHMREAVDKWLTEGVVKPSDSPWGAPAFVVPKPHNGGLRMVVDYRKLNSMTIPDVWPLPLPETLFAQLHGAEIFSMFDAHSGFTQQSLHPNSQKLTAFVTPFGLFEFTRLSMGLRNGPSSFSRAMYFMTRDLEDMLVYIDDVNIYSRRPDPKSSDEVLYKRHFDSVRQFFERCLETNLRLNGKKCGLGSPSIRFLGHIISKDGIHPDPEKVAAVASMQPCTTQTEVRAFLGLVGYYRSFIPMMAKLQIPLNKLLLKGTTFDWTPDCQSSFEQLKASLTNECLRRFPNPNEPFELHTDASGYAIGGVLMQRNSEGHLQPIEYYSRSLSASEFNYSTFEKECLAILVCVKKFHIHLACGAFTIYTDHRALASLMTMRDPTRRIARWLVTLGEYCFTAVYREGKLNVVPDALSRLPSANVSVPSVNSAGDGSLTLHNFPEVDYQDTGFEFPEVKLPDGTTICCIAYHPRIPMVKGVHTWTVASISSHLRPTSVAATRSGIRYNPLAETDSISTNSSAADALEALPGVNHILPELDLRADFTSLDKCQQLIGRHFWDSEENKQYVITDVWFDNEYNKMIGTRHPLIPDIDAHEPADPYVLAPSDELDENIYELDYFIRELRLTPDLGFTPQVSYDDVRSQVYADSVATDLDTLLQQNRISEEEISFIDDEHGAGHYYRRTHLPPHNTLTYQLIIPSNDLALQTVLLHTCHTTGGHSRLKRTYNLLQRRVWWYGMRAATEAFINACPTCAASGTSQDRAIKSYAIENHPEVCRPCQRISIDCMGPFPKTLSGNSCIILAVDHFTKHVIGAAIPDQKAETIAQFLVEELFYKIGAPDIILTDNGTEFKNDLNAHIISSLGSHLRHTAAYHPAANGQVERINAPVKASIKAMCEDAINHLDWDQHVAPAVFAYNVCVNTTTGFTPFFLQHGREARLTVDAILPVPKMRNPSHIEYVEKLARTLNTAKRQTQSQLSTAHSLYNRPPTVQRVINQLRFEDDDAAEQPHADPPIGQPFPARHRRARRRFELDDKVLLWTETVKIGNAKKLTKNWRGPYDIIRVISPTIYKIQLSGTVRKPKTTHINRLKPFHPLTKWN